uniref:TNFR-Cys domain-containing protein n=1 Tax=Sphaeramia orbicularis TaxID=375764 RepID=A0A672YNT1_9TELE
MPRTWSGKHVDLILLLLIQFAFNRVLSLTCLKAEYQIGQECCPKCPAGNRVNKHCTEFRSTSCLPCDDGTFMDQLTGQITCFPCTRCDPGSGLKVKRPCTSVLDAVCEPQEGFYCTDNKDDSCVRAQKHKKCDGGQYIQNKGTSSADTECSPCTDGTFSDGTFTQCQPHTQ